MVTARVAVCFLLLTLPTVISRGADTERYSTDWLTPPIQISNEPGDICAIDLEIAPHESNGWAGTITLYSGQPAYNQFGDADKTLLQSRAIRVTFRKSTDSEIPNRVGTKRKDPGVLYKPDGDTTLAHLRLVLDAEQPGDCRLLVMNPNGQINRILPLQSERLQHLAKQSPESSKFEMRLHSNLFIGNEDRFNFIRVVGRNNELMFEHDRNYFDVDQLGNICSTTAMGFFPQKLTLTDLHVPDPTGQERHVFKCDLTIAPPFDKLRDDREATSADSQYLILNPREGGWHRLILKKSGQIDRILPMYSDRFKSWLRIESQITDATEKQVFERLSQEIPYFDGFSFENERVVKVVISIPNGKEELLSHLAELPHLTTLEIGGDLTVGAQLEDLVQLEKLHFSHGRITEDVLLHAGHLSNLRSLSFYSVRLDCRGLKHLSGLRALTRFAFWEGERGNFAENFDNSCVAIFSMLPDIEYLNLHALPLTESGIKLLPVSARLAEVSFHESVPLPAVLNFSQLNPKARVEMGSNRWRLADGELRLPGSVTDEDLEALKNVEGLRLLTLGFAELITDQGLAHLTSLKLKEFDLTHNRNVTDVGVTSIASIDTLESLNFWYCERLTNSAIAALKRLPNLRKINIFGTKIDPNVLQAAIPNCEIIR